MSGSTVEIDGDVGGSVYAVGNFVKISGNVDGNVYAVGMVVKIEGIVAGNVFVAGQTLTLENDVWSDAFLAGDSISVKFVGGDVRVAGADLALNDIIGGDLMFSGGSVDYADDQVGGDVYIDTKSESKAGSESNGDAGGDVQNFASVLNAMKKLGRSGKFRKGVIILTLLKWLAKQGGLFLLMFVALKLMPVKIKTYMKSANKGYVEMFTSAVVGLVFPVLAVGFGLLVLVLSLVSFGVLGSLTVPLTGMVLVLSCLAMILGRVVGWYVVGEKVARRLFKMKKNNWNMIAGAGVAVHAVTSALVFIPIVGVLFMLFNMADSALGVGLVALGKLNTMKKA